VLAIKDWNCEGYGEFRDHIDTLKIVRVRLSWSNTQRYCQEKPLAVEWRWSPLDSVMELSANEY
jgi:hypothetical protein